MTATTSLLSLVYASQPTPLSLPKNSGGVATVPRSSRNKRSSGRLCFFPDEPN